jgi:hypothetical protein
MLQRIQSLYLLMAAVVTSLFFFFPIAQYLKGEAIYVFDITGVYHLGTNEGLINVVPLLVITVAAMIVALSAIFLYKNRLLQIRLGSLNILLYVILIAGIFFYSDKAENMLGKDGLLTNYAFGAIIPSIGVILTFLANRAIKKDEALVRAADRIR